jgi:hypothetical protein
VAAQDSLRSASLPESGPGPTVNVQGDLFIVPPDFYRTRPDPESSRLFFPQVLVWPPGVPGVPYPWQYPLSQYPLSPYVDGPISPYVDEPVPEAGVDRPVDLLEPTQPIVEAPPPPPPMVPGPPKTFYVIPRCYAGDRPPPPGWLRPGCDRSKMRVIPPE